VRPVPRKTTREQVRVLGLLFGGGALFIAVGLLVPPLVFLVGPGGMLLGTGLAVALLWYGAWRWR
jgi:hypothetical protein